VPELQRLGTAADLAIFCKAAGVPQVTAHGRRGLHGTLAVETGPSAHAVAAPLERDRKLEEARERRRVRRANQAQTPARRMTSAPPAK
jgi:hypothetical protein